MSNTTKDAAIALPDWSDTDPGSHEIARDNVVHPPVRDASPEVEPDAQDRRADAAARLLSNPPPPSYSEIAEPITDPTAESDGVESDDDEAGDDFDDDETPDALDKAAARIRYDYEKRTLRFPEPVNGVAMLNEMVAAITRFNAALPEGAAETIVLLTVMTYCVYPCGLRFAPRLMVRKPVSNAGGTNLLTVLLYLVRRPKYNSGITDANFLRQSNKRRTVIIDECDGVLKGNHKLVKMVNAGHGHQGTETRIIKNVSVEYKVFSPVILCGIGDFAPVTIRNRSFVVAMKRMMAGEDADEFNPDDHAPMLRIIREKVIRWVEDHVEAIRECRPALDRALAMNRQRENILTLLKIADVVGGEWSQRARDALTALTARDKPLDENELLIGDIAEILLDPEVMDLGDPPQRIGTRNVVFSGDLLLLLKERFPHRLLYESNFTQAKLASMLSTFDMEPQRVGKRRGKQVLRWYARSDFDDAIARYAPDTVTAFAEEPATPLSPEVPDQEPVAQPTAPQIVYTKARVVEPAKGDKRRGDRLRAAVDAVIQNGEAEPDTVEFISARFWVIQREGEACFVHLNRDCLEWCPIGEAGLLAEDGVVRINPEKSLPLADSDFVVMRPLVNKYRKTANSPA